MSGETKWTKGPWAIADSDLDRSPGDDGPRWDIHIPGKETIGYVYREADARLMTAAPMLFEGAQDTVEALKLLRIGLRHRAPETLNVIETHIDELEFALAKARGES